MAARREHSFTAVRQDGLRAYEALCSDLVSVAMALTDEELRAVSPLPPEHEDMPLRVLASLGEELNRRELGFLRERTFESDRGPRRLDGVAELSHWHRDNWEMLHAYVPEMGATRLRWRGWEPPPSGLPFGADRVTWHDLEGFVRDFARAGFGERVARSVARHPGVFLYVLLRDWFADFGQLLRRLEIDPDALMVNARELLVGGARDDVSDGVLKMGPLSIDDIIDAEREVARELGLVTSPWTMLAAFAVDGGPLTSLDSRLTRARIEAAIHELVPELTFESRSPSGPGERSLLQDAYRPSSAIASDAPTTHDELGYRLYADAITRFILDARTSAPLTIGVKAPWGAGKTSLMRMIQQRIDPRATARRTATEDSEDDARLTNREVLSTAALPPDQAGRELQISRLPPDTDRERTTIWFNAWKYQSSEQLWAGLAHAIVSQVEQRMSYAERERMWASLNIRRLDVGAIRRRIYGAFALYAVRSLIALPLAAIVALFASVASPAVGRGTLAAGLLVTLGDVARRWRTFVEQDVASSAPSLVADPGYADRLGFLHLVHEDMERILALVASREQPLVVFIDDLDRCSYTTVVQVIEALNSFLAGDFRNCIFVIAMEPDLVAAQIHVAYASLFERIAQRKGEAAESDLGWRFLEKMVQLPLTLPPPSPEQIDRFVGSLVAPDAHDDFELQDDNPEIEHARAQIRAQRRGASLDGIGDAMERVKAAIPAESARQQMRRDAVIQQAARIEYASDFDDGHPDVQQMLRRHAAALGGNPREIKRFVNILRFYAYVQFWRRSEGLRAPDLAGTAKLATLAVRYPHLLSALGTTITWQDQERCVLECLERANGDKAVEPHLLALLPESLRAALDGSPALEALLRSDPAVGADAAGFL